MVTGVAPYVGDNFMEILTKKATVEPLPPRLLRPDLPEPVERVILRALARDPAQRPPSMEAFEYELTKCLAGRGVAVAKMLGMPVDPALMMGDSVISGPTPQPALISPMLAVPVPTPPPAPVPRDTPEPSARLPFEGLAALGADHEEVSEPTAVVLHNRSSIKMGIFYAISVMVIAGGTIGYVAARSEPLGQRPQDTSAVNYQSPRAAPPAPETVPPPTEPPKPKVVARVEPPPAPKEDAKSDVVPPPDRPALDERLPAPRSKRDADKVYDSASSAKASGEWTKARSLYSRLAKGKFRKADGLLGIAEVAFETKDLDEAVQFAKAALDAGGGDAARLILGHAYLKKNQIDEAIDLYRTVLRNNPKNGEAKSSLAEAMKH